jgi:hypothetical protein
VLRGTLLGSVAVVFALALGVASSGAAGHTTVVRYFHGFKAGGIAPGIQVEQTARGHCWETSALESRAYAWRCFRGNYILDPCFSAAPHSSYVLCPYELWSRRVLRLRLTKPLPAWHAYPVNESLPVGVWTTTGKHCEDFSGATTEIQHRPIRYSCRGGGVLVGLAHRTTPVWTIFYATGAKSRRLTRVGITHAWW